jgi:hypothetical protein
MLGVAGDARPSRLGQRGEDTSGTDTQRVWERPVRVFEDIRPNARGVCGHKRCIARIGLGADWP